MAKIANRYFENVAYSKFLGKKYQIKIWFRRRTRVMLPTIQSKTFCLLVCLKYTLLKSSLWLCMGVKVGLWHYGKNTDWGCLRTGCWGRIFGPKRNEATGGWRKLHNEELKNLYSSTGIIRMIMSRRVRRLRHIARMREKRNAYRISVGKPEGKRPLGRPRRRWVDILWRICPM
jgi:hypothetical protein